jgi:hypothetical protein
MSKNPVLLIAKKVDKKLLAIDNVVRRMRGKPTHKEIDARISKETEQRMNPFILERNSRSFGAMSDESKQMTHQSLGTSDKNFLTQTKVSRESCKLKNF